MASWCLNVGSIRDRARGVTDLYLCDDDLLYPEAFDTYWNFYQKNDRVPTGHVMRHRKHSASLDPAGQEPGYWPPDRGPTRGPVLPEVNGLDCRVDSLQMCHTAKIPGEVPRRYTKPPQYHSEDKRDAHSCRWHLSWSSSARSPSSTTLTKVLSMNRRTVESRQPGILQPRPSDALR